MTPSAILDRSIKPTNVLRKWLKDAERRGVLHRGRTMIRAVDKAALAAEALAGVERWQAADYSDTAKARAEVSELVRDHRTLRLKLYAESEYGHAFHELTAPADTAQELRNQRTAARAEREMSEAPDDQKSSVARRLIREAADPAAVGVLVAELPSMGANAAIVRHAVNEALPQLADKAAKVAKAKQPETVIEVEAERVRSHIKSGQRLHVPVVDAGRYDPDR